MVEMLVDAGQEMDSTRDCKYKFSINLAKKKSEYRTNPVNYPFGIHFILLLSMPRTGISGCQLVHFGLFLSVRPLVFLSCLVEKTTENFKNVETKAKKSQI